MRRRTFLQTAALAAAAGATRLGALPLGGCLPRARFFTSAEFATLAALCDRILPPDGDPGGAELGAPIYIERLLTAFDEEPVFVFAGGPYSGRNPFPDLRTGTPSDEFPENDFRMPAPLSPLQELYWRAEILGADAAGLPAHLVTQRGTSLRGLRDLYREGLAAVDALAMAAHGALFAELDTDAQDDVLARLDRSNKPFDAFRGVSFADLLIRHTLEGCFAAPEYGGNRDGAGWRMIGIEGDSQPLGYSLYSEAEGRYREREGHPVSTPNPDEIAADGSLAPRPIGPDAIQVQQGITQFTGLLESLIPGACA